LVEVLLLTGNVCYPAILEKYRQSPRLRRGVDWQQFFPNSSRVAFRENGRKAAIVLSIISNLSAKLLEIFHTPKLFAIFLLTH